MAGSISFCSPRENLLGVEEHARVVIFAETQLNWMVAAFATWFLKGQARMLGMTPG
jgi:long-subunit acyl-CoA synthetase (AMP-forming)